MDKAKYGNLRKLPTTKGSYDNVRRKCLNILRTFFPKRCLVLTSDSLTGGVKL